MKPADEPLDERDRAFLWDWLKHEGTLFIGRQQLFAVSEAMLLAAYATLAAAADPRTWALGWMIVAGFVSSAFWLYTNRVHREDTVLPIRKRLAKGFRLYDEIESQRRKRLARTSPLMGYVYPALIAFVWLMLLLDFLQGLRGAAA